MLCVDSVTSCCEAAIVFRPTAESYFFFSRMRWTRVPAGRPDRSNVLIERVLANGEKERWFTAIGYSRDGRCILYAAVES